MKKRDKSENVKLILRLIRFAFIVFFGLFSAIEAVSALSNDGFSQNTLITLAVPVICAVHLAAEIFFQNRNKNPGGKLALSIAVTVITAVAYPTMYIFCAGIAEGSIF